MFTNKTFYLYIYQRSNNLKEKNVKYFSSHFNPSIANQHFKDENMFCNTIQCFKDLFLHSFLCLCQQIVFYSVILLIYELSSVTSLGHFFNIYTRMNCLSTPLFELIVTVLKLRFYEKTHHRYQDWNFIFAPDARFVYKRLISDARIKKC